MYEGGPQECKRETAFPPFHYKVKLRVKRKRACPSVLITSGRGGAQLVANYIIPIRIASGISCLRYSMIDDYGFCVTRRVDNVMKLVNS